VIPRWFVGTMCLLSAALCATLFSCGYHVSGHSDLMPKTIHSVCIPAFSNVTTRYKLTDHIPEALAHEFIARTQYKIVPDCSTADAVLRGSVNNFLYNPTVYDPVSGRASEVDLHVIISATLTERTTNKTLFTRVNMDVRERYEISVDPRAYFNESDAALDRAAKSVAQSLVSAILANF
jgi:Lipopolysaccharide-assembly